MQLKFEAKLLEEKKKSMTAAAERGYNGGYGTGYNSGYGNHAHNTRTGYSNHAHNTQNVYGNYAHNSQTDPARETPWKTHTQSNSKPFSSIFNEEPSFLL